MPHLHLSIQSGDDLILKRMKRRHVSADIRRIVARARSIRPDIAIGADFIAGFPTESEAHAQNTRNLIAECDINFLHVFPYSPRPGTPAARMPQWAPSLISERAAQLRQLGDEMRQKYLSRRIGQNEEILWESDNFGHTAHFADFRLNPSSNQRGKIGEIATIMVTDYADGELMGRIL